MQRCRRWRRRSAPGSEAVGNWGEARNGGAEPRPMACYVARMAGQVEHPHPAAGDEAYQQRQSDCDMTDGRQQCSGWPRAATWAGWDGVWGWLAGGTEERTHRAPNVNLDGSSSSFPRNRRARANALCAPFLLLHLAVALSLHLSSSRFPCLPPPASRLLAAAIYTYLLRVPWSGASHQHPIVIWHQESRVAVIPRSSTSSTALHAPIQAALAVSSVALASVAPTLPPARLHLLAPPPTAAAAASQASQGAQPYLRLDSALASHRPRLAPPSTSRPSNTMAAA
jgi:hypothetical protein